MVTVQGDLIRQAAKLLEGISEPNNSVIEVRFNHEDEIIEVWNMLADNEHMIGYVEY